MSIYRNYSTINYIYYINQYSGTFSTKGLILRKLFWLLPYSKSSIPWFFIIFHQTILKMFSSNRNSLPSSRVRRAGGIYRRYWIMLFVLIAIIVVLVLLSRRDVDDENPFAFIQDDNQRVLQKN